jgi:ribosomal protein S12 methylthiotransferase accessory factor
MREGDGSDYEDVRRTNLRWFSVVDPVRPYADMSTYRFDDLWGELKWLLQRIRACALPGPYVADLTRDGIDLPVVRVLVPGLECWHRDRKRIGRRLVKAFGIGRKLGTAGGVNGHDS